MIIITWSTSLLITSTCQHSSAPLYLHTLSSSGLPFTTSNSHQTQYYLPVPLTFQISCYPPALLLRSSPLVPRWFLVPAKRHFHQSTAKTPLNGLYLRIPHLPVSPHDLHPFHLSINLYIITYPLSPACVL